MNYKIRKFLYEKDVLDIDVNSNQLLKIHLSILKKKRLLNSAFKTFYKDMSKICDQFFSIDGLEIELGSGVGFFKDIRKNVLTSEFQRKGINSGKGNNKKSVRAGTSRQPQKLWLWRLMNTNRL